MDIKKLLDLVSKEKIVKEREMKGKAILIGAGVIATLGMAVGILIAPKSGKATREGFKKKAVSTAETIKDMEETKIEMMKDSVAHAVKEICGVIKYAFDKIDGVKDDIKDGIKHGCDDIKHKVN